MRITPLAGRVQGTTPSKADANAYGSSRVPIAAKESVIIHEPAMIHAAVAILPFTRSLPDRGPQLKRSAGTSPKLALCRRDRPSFWAAPSYFTGAIQYQSPSRQRLQTAVPPQPATLQRIS